MPDPDLGIDALRAIKEQFSLFCANRGKVSEADTRVKVIDRILKEVLGWPEEAISREDHVESGIAGLGGRMYRMSFGGRVAFQANRSYRARDAVSPVFATP